MQSSFAFCARVNSLCALLEKWLLPRYHCTLIQFQAYVFPHIELVIHAKYIGMTPCKGHVSWLLPSEQQSRAASGYRGSRHDALLRSFFFFFLFFLTQMWPPVSDASHPLVTAQNAHLRGRNAAGYVTRCHTALT